MKASNASDSSTTKGKGLQANRLICVRCSRDSRNIGTGASLDFAIVDISWGCELCKDEKGAIKTEGDKNNKKKPGCSYWCMETLAPATNIKEVVPVNVWSGVETI